MANFATRGVVNWNLQIRYHRRLLPEEEQSPEELLSMPPPWGDPTSGGKLNICAEGILV